MLQHVSANNHYIKFSRSQHLSASVLSNIQFIHKIKNVYPVLILTITLKLLINV